MRPADNPFSTRRLERLKPRLRDTTVSELADRLMSPGARGAIVGNHGTGKTLLLDALRHELETRGVPTVRLSFEHGERLSLAGERRRVCQTVYFFDGADSLSTLAWLRLRWSLRSARGLVVTTHGRELLPELYRTHMDIDLFGELVCELGAEALPRRMLEHALTTSGNNAREALLHLYDRAAKRAENC